MSRNLVLLAAVATITCSSSTWAGGWGNGPSWNQFKKDVDQAGRNAGDVVKTVVPPVLGVVGITMQNGAGNGPTHGTMPEDSESSNAGNSQPANETASKSDSEKHTALPNEGRAEHFGEVVGGVLGQALGAGATVYGAGKLNAPTATAPIIGSGSAVATDGFETAGRDLGSAVGRAADKNIEVYKKETGYDSRNDPRYWGGD